MVVASDSEEPAADEEQGRWEAPKTPEEDTRVVVVHQTPSPSASVPVTPGRDMQISVADNVSPRSLEGQRAAETLEIEMGHQSVCKSIQCISRRGLHPSIPVVPKVTQKMVEDACRMRVRDRHLRSPPVWPEGGEPHLTASQELEEALPEPPRV